MDARNSKSLEAVRDLFTRMLINWFRTANGITGWMSWCAG
jgi:hypothetical protein